MKTQLFLIALTLCSLSNSVKLQNKEKVITYEEEICEEPYEYEQLEDDGCYEQGFVKVIHEVKERPVYVPQYIEPQIQYIPQPIYIPIRQATHHRNKQPVIIINGGQNGGCNVVNAKSMNRTLLANATDMSGIRVVDQSKNMQETISAPVEEHITQEAINTPLVQQTEEQVEEDSTEQVEEESTEHVEDQILDEWETVAEDVEEESFLG